MQTTNEIEQPSNSSASILINPSLKHLTHPLTSSLKQTSYPPKSDDRHHIRPFGRRRKQRFENAQFTSNPHVCRPTPSDYQLWNSNLQKQTRFPIQPPRGYPSSLYIPPAEPIPADPFSATMGAFNRSLKGVRKSIRPLIRQHHQSQDHPGPVEEMISIIDHHISTWINGHTVWKSTEIVHSRQIIDSNPWPPSSSNTIRNQPIPLLDQQPSIVEISRSPYMLNWDVPSPFGRYLVHCIARYYGIVSFSRQQSILPPTHDPHDNDDDDHSQWKERRIVCMIKAHFPTRRGSRRIDGHETLDTPPATDLDSELSGVEVMSEVDSVPTTEDDQMVSDPTGQPKSRFLSSIDEQKETDEHQMVDPDLNKSSKTLVLEDSDNQQEKIVVEKPRPSLTPLVNNSSDSSSLLKNTITNAQDYNSSSIVSPNIQSAQASSSLSLHNGPPFSTHHHQSQPESKYKIKRDTVFVPKISDPSINFLDWVRGS